MESMVARAREAFARQAWEDARARLAAAEPLDAEDLERLAIAAHLVGRDDESAAAWERAHRAWLDRADTDRAAICAVWLSLALVLRGAPARAEGWLARTERLVADAGHDCAAAGFLLIPAFLGALMRGDRDTAQVLADDIAAIGERFDEPDLCAFGLLARGQAALARGETRRAMALLDEVMVSVTTGEVGPITMGIVYCAVIEACLDMNDLRRAAEWTEALHGWCRAQPDLVPYRGQCLVHRSQILQAHGAWAEAAIEAERARRWLEAPAHPALGLAFYQQGELHRLRGERDEAEHAYRAASRQGREPVPGFALLRLADGNVAAAVAAVRRMVDESHGPPGRPAILAAAVEVFLAAADDDAAGAASDELAAIAAAADVPLLHALADYAMGSVRLAAGDARGALGALGQACTRWRDLEMPYDVARTRVAMALACREVGDDDAADLHLEAAGATFARLGARPDQARVARLTRPRTAVRRDELTDREREVLRHVAAGATNRQIATTLVISEHTVARHLQNIFTKLGLSSRAAATAYAYEHGLVGAGSGTPERGEN